MRPLGACTPLQTLAVPPSRTIAKMGSARLVGPALAPMLAAHPGLTLSLYCGDDVIDLVEARIDLAIRIGTLADSDRLAAAHRTAQPRRRDD